MDPKKKKRLKKTLKQRIQHANELYNDLEMGHIEQTQRKKWENILRTELNEIIKSSSSAYVVASKDKLHAKPISATQLSAAYPSDFGRLTEPQLRAHLDKGPLQLSDGLIVMRRDLFQRMPIEENNGPIMISPSTHPPKLGRPKNNDIDEQNPATQNDVVNMLAIEEDPEKVEDVDTRLEAAAEVTPKKEDFFDAAKRKFSSFFTSPNLLDEATAGASAAVKNAQNAVEALTNTEFSIDEINAKAEAAIRHAQDEVNATTEATTPVRDAREVIEMVKGALEAESGGLGPPTTPLKNK